MSAPVRRGARRLFGLVGLLGVFALTLAVAIQVFLNLWLPVLVNPRPERIRMTYRAAWMVVPGKIEVRDLEIRQQGRKDQWWLAIDRATVEIDLSALGRRTIHVVTADAHGATFRWRARVDAVPLGAVDHTPPIPGLTNPPNPNPEDIYPDAKPWRIVLGDAHIGGVREVWLGDHRYVGDATASGALIVEAHTWLEVQGAELQLDGGVVTRGPDALIEDVRGRIALGLAGSNPEDAEGRGLFGSVTGTVALEAVVANLSFLDFYLKSAPWLRLSGGHGGLLVDVSVVDGAFEDGSLVSADVQDVVARFLSYSVVGDGQVRLAVGAAEGVPRTTIGVDFLDFAITLDGDARPHVMGQGFRVSATTSDVAMDRPFTSLSVVLDLPEAQIPDVAVYNLYAPPSIGLALLGGTGTVRGRLEVSTEENLCRGELYIEGHGVRATLDELQLRGDVSLHAVVPAGDLDTGRYDISGTTLDLRRIQVVSGSSARRGKDDSSGWWASVRVPKGGAAVGAPVFLDGHLDVKFRDTVPFITIFSEKQPLPGWIRGLLGVRPVSGRARIRLGNDVLRVADFRLLAGQFEVLLELRRRREMVGKLYARFGSLSLGMGLAAEGTHLQVFGARKWYDAEPDPD